MSGGALPPQVNSPFGHFSYLFPTQQNPFFSQQQRIKLKRSRQRVDAGEPRNSYQLQQTRNMMNNKVEVSDLFTLPWNEEKEEEQATDLSMNKQQEEEAVDDTKPEPSPEEQPVVSNGSATTDSSGSSSSRRKSFFPQKNTSGEDKEEAECTENQEEPEKEEEEAEAPSTVVSALQAQLSEPSNKLAEIIDNHNRSYSNLFDRKVLDEMDKGRHQQRDMRNIVASLCASIKSEVLDSVSGSIDKIISEFFAAESARLQMESRPNLLMHPLFPYPPPPFMPQATNSIFPPTFNPFNNIAALNNLRKPLEDEVKRKKMKLDRVVPSERASPGSDRGTPLVNPTPLPNYFPATMVGHPMYGAGAFDRDDSPVDSDDVSEGPYDPNVAVSSTLTPMHLRKAKLMFFYTRYPNSSLLKSYFPDIRFNKNNTAQLVKWFSNFREFYYIQMEKYAKQAVAEGIRNREEIVVTAESDIFKQLNQHYNRNNHIQPPERLVWVVQETLREFFVAILHGKDAEPSWKKTIYKVISRLDDPIPDYFKDPNFLERLE